MVGHDLPFALSHTVFDVLFVGAGGLEWDEWAVSAALAGETKGHRFSAAPPVAAVGLFKNYALGYFHPSERRFLCHL